MNRGNVDSYLTDGCGRCERYQTPSCKVLLWTAPLAALRALLGATELEESLKWGSPTYTLDGKNVAMLASTNEYCAISFLKGVLLSDPEGLLEQPGPNTRSARYVRFTTLDQVEARRERLAALIAEAIANEKAGRKVELDAAPEEIPVELQERMDADPALAAAFEALTPGRQRSFVLHIAGAKQEQTRRSRAEKCEPKIFAGKGFFER